MPMADITKFAFLNSMWLLRDYLTDIVIGGGWAPLIYYHNIRLEVDRNEMIPLQPFDTDYDLWVPWLKDTRAAIDSIEGAEYQEDVARKEARAAQIRMAYQCFQPLIPPHIERELRGIYLKDESNEPS